MRIRQLFNCTVQNYYLRTLKWMEDLAGKPLPPIQPTLDVATGTVGGFDVNYHDVKLLAIDWEAKPVDDAAIKGLAKDDAATRLRLLDWGFNTVSAVPAQAIVSDNPAIKVEAWKRAGDAGGRGTSVLVILPLFLLARRLPTRDAAWPIVFCGLLDAVGFIAFAYAAAVGPLSVASVTATQWGTAAALIGIVGMRERLYVNQYVGIAVTLLAVTGLGLLG